MGKSLAVLPSEDNTKTSFPVNGKTWLNRKLCVIDVWLLLKHRYEVEVTLSNSIVKNQMPRPLADNSNLEAT